MNSWQDNGDKDMVKTESEAISCGTVCCVAGWLAISPEFKRTGRHVDGYIGCPEIGAGIDYYSGTDAVGIFLKAEEKLGNIISGFKPKNAVFDNNNKFYGCELDNITPTIVINRLEQLLATGE